jgi:hypothetical protein
MKIRMLTDMGGGWYAGSDFAYKNTRRGDIVEASELEGERLVRIGYATTNLTCDYRDLPMAFRTPMWQR